MTQIRDIARGKWPRILRSLGIAREYLVDKHGPCPMCGGSDRFRFDDRGSGTWICNQCGAGDGFKLIMSLTGETYQQVAAKVLALLEGAGVDRVEVAYKPLPPRLVCATQEQIDAMARLWNQGRPIVEGDVAATYLLGRGLGVSRRLQNLRVITSRDGQSFVMLARVHAGSGHTHDTPMCQLHRTIVPIVDEWGTKERKLMPGAHPDGSAVRLFKADRDVLGIAEGIETALSAATLFQVPCWAALTAGRLATFIPPPGVRRVRIFADHDSSHVGMVAAVKLAQRLDRVGGYHATIEMPPEHDSDWNDVLRDMMAGAINADVRTGDEVHL